MVTRWSLPHRKEKELYQRAIELLNEEFKRRGLIPTIGMEIEFNVVDKSDELWTTPLGDNYIDAKLLNELLRQINGDLAGLNKAAAIMDGPVSRFYKELLKYKYEVASVPFYADQAVDALEKIKAYATSAAFKYGDENNLNDSPHGGHHTFMVTHNAMPERKRLTPALHTSIGFLATNPEGAHDAFHGKLHATTYMESRDPLAEAMKNHNPALMLLFAPKPASYARFNSSNRTSPRFHKLAKFGGKDGASLRFDGKRIEDESLLKNGFSSGVSYRIENRLPGADTPVYKAILGTMLSAYAAMLDTVQVDSEGVAQYDEYGCMTYKDGIVAHPDQDVAPNIEEAAQDFKTGKPLWDLLDTLAPGEQVGTKIYNHELERCRVITAQEAVGR